jgi:hypothetical protein
MDWGSYDPLQAIGSDRENAVALALTLKDRLT